MVALIEFVHSMGEGNWACFVVAYHIKSGDQIEVSAPDVFGGKPTSNSL